MDAGLTLEFLGTLTSVTTWDGETITVTNEGGVVKLNGIETIAPEIKASNGIIIPIGACCS